MTIRPNFFIVGAPKSGTTAMSGYLASHPNVHFANPKEPDYFCTDFPGQREVTTLEEYLNIFASAPPEARAIGEGSVWYLYSQEALRNIREFDSQAKIIVMLRNPVEQVYSMHQELYVRRYETEGNFVEAWNLQETRRQGKAIPKYCKEPKFLQYADIARYGEQIERLLDIFPREQIAFVVFDDLKKNTREVYTRLLEHLGVPDDGRVAFPPSLESRKHRFHWLGSFLINQPSWLLGAKSAVKKGLRIERLGVRDFVARYNTVKAKRKELPAGFAESLKATFREDVAKVSDLLGRDLRHWCQ